LSDREELVKKYLESNTKIEYLEKLVSWKKICKFQKWKFGNKYL